MEEGEESKAGESQGEEMDVEEQRKEETGGEGNKVEMEDIKICLKKPDVRLELTLMRVSG